MVTILAATAASWATLMAVAPLLQVRRMLRRRSSEDVSVGYLLILLPGFVLWTAYGVAIQDMALIAPNVVAFLICSATVVCALRLRRPRNAAPNSQPQPTRPDLVSAERTQEPVR